MPKTLAEESSPYTLNPALLALKPRQVLISSISRADMGKESSKALTLESEQKALLLRSVALYLERCGFSKCFKKLLSEAEIEKKELNSNTLPDLEEMYSEFLKKSHLEAVEVKDESGNVDEKEKEEEKKEVVVNGITEASAMEGVEKVKKQRKKKKKETKSEVTEEEEKVVKETDAEMEEGKKEKKKKKKNKSKSTEAESLGDDDKEKVSKKRKRSEPEEAKEQTGEDDEESKRRKKEEKNVVEEEEAVQETPVKQSDVEENSNAVEKSETKSTNRKSGKGLSNSKEPKKPFQRVNVEEVVFTDDRLKDNSYWAKDGADIGYGAKAQEVLGQVRGRGFRHEKTKKKRGSYRGGEIDLESHSVKFDYSDEE
uniref:Nucleolar and coiled-body phosphoprotein 1 n=1 Tax=Noccaea caerulescens TaxID=107243 RepID=A0A1J3EVJ1_NOCCA